MTKINFENLPSTSTPINATNLNKLNNVAISSTEPNTGEEVWLQKGKNLFDKNAPIYRQVAVASTTILNTGVRINFTSTNSGVYAAYYIGKYSNFFGQTMTVKSIIQPNSSRKVMLNIWAITSGSTGSFTVLSEQDATGTNVTITNSYTFNNSTYNDYDVVIGLYAKAGSGSVTTSDYTDFTDLQVELNSSATSYEAYVDKKIYTKNAYDTYEEFYDESEVGKEVYSLGETRIGTWINGKPLYKKVLTGTTPAVTTTGTSVTNDYPTNVSNADIMFISEGFFVVSAQKLPFNFFNTSGRYLKGYLKSNANFTITSDNTGYSEKTFYVVLKYTKTTD